jgi:hypothetical protein
MKIPH